MGEFDLLPGQHWYPTSAADPRAFALYRRHYSAKGRGPTNPWRKKGFGFVEPGECMTLLTPYADALFVWRLGLMYVLGRRPALFCVIFRNESAYRSSDLILEAEQLAWRRWPGERLHTWVNPAKVASAVPGWCFRRARWKRVGQSKGGLLLFEKRPPKDT